MGSAGLVRKPMVFMDEGTMVSRVVFTFFSSPATEIEVSYLKMTIWSSMK